MSDKAQAIELAVTLFLFLDASEATGLQEAAQHLVSWTIKMETQFGSRLTFQNVLFKRFLFYFLFGLVSYFRQIPSDLYNSSYLVCICHVQIKSVNIPIQQEQSLLLHLLRCCKKILLYRKSECIPKHWRDLKTCLIYTDRKRKFDGLEVTWRKNELETD